MIQIHDDYPLPDLQVSTFLIYPYSGEGKITEGKAILILLFK